MNNKAQRDSLQWSSLLIFAVVLVCLLALPGYHKNDSIDLSVAFYSVLLLLSYRRFDVQSAVATILLVTACVLPISVATSSLVARQLPTYEYLIICKPFALALLLSLSLRPKLSIFLWNLRLKIFRIIIYFALLKYFVSFYLFNYDRPFLFHENNFEIPLFILLYAWVYPRVKFNFDFIALTTTVILGGGLSGYALLAFLVFAYSRVTLKRLVIMGLASSLLIFGAFFLSNVAERISTLSSEERVSWIRDLQREKKGEGEELWKLMSIPAALPESFCKTLTRYNKSADAKENECYSRVLHGNIPRLIVDFGVLPTLFFFASFFYFAYKKTGIRLACLIFGVGFLNGLSVSGFANIFFIAGVMLLFTSRSCSTRQSSSPATLRSPNRAFVY